jgi:enoyl-CoA hydratase/carnithine racemase
LVGTVSLSTDGSADSVAEDTGLRRELTDDGVLVLTIDRPQRRNSWNPQVESAYLGALDEAVNDDAVRVVVLTGAGRMFCPGMDTDRLELASTGKSEPYMGGRRRPQTSPLSFPKPIIAAVNGPCAGVGFVHALMCDLRFTVPGAKWTAAFSRMGLVAEDGIAWRLQRLIGAGRAADLLLSARVVSGSEAVSIGLANGMFEPAELMPRVLAYASDLARNCSPVSLALIKRQLVTDADASLEEARLRSVAWLSLARTFPDFAEGVEAFTARRSPSFPPLPRDLQSALNGLPQ